MNALAQLARLPRGNRPHVSKKKKRKRESFSESKTRMNRLIFSFVVLRAALVSFPHPSFRERL